MEQELRKAMPTLRASGEDYTIVAYKGTAYAVFVDEETMLEWVTIFHDCDVCMLGDDISAVVLGTIH